MPAPPDSPPAACRSWRRLHRLTSVILLLVLAVLVLVVVPGEPFGLWGDPYPDGRGFAMWKVFGHGWPWIFLLSGTLIPRVRTGRHLAHY